VSHGDPITDRDGIELEGGSSSLTDGLFDYSPGLVQMHVTGNHLAKAVCDSDKRLVDIRVSKAARAKQCTVWSPLEPFLDSITSHYSFLS
jgi:hypothetical protein